MSGERYYPSKRDLWLVVLIWAAVASMCFAGFQVWRDQHEPVSVRALTSLFMVVAALFMLHVLYNTGYTITREFLLIRAGLFRRKIPLDSIEEVKPSRSLLSGPALSMDRLQVRCRGARLGVLISPDDRKKFLRDLASRCPAARIEQ